MAWGTNCIIKTNLCHLYSLKTIKYNHPTAIQHFTAAQIQFLQLLHSCNVLGTTKNNYNNLLKAFIPLPPGRSDFMLYARMYVTGDS